MGGSTDYTDWQRQLSIMMEKLPQAGEGWGVQAPPFTTSTITYKVEMYAPAERVDTLPLFLFYLYMYSMG